MKNYGQEGDTLTFTSPSGDVTSGNGYLIGNLFVVAQHSALEGASFEADTEGVFTLPKAATITPAQGVVLYWDNTAKNVTTTASGNTKIGIHASAVAAAANAATLPVKLITTL